MLDSISNVGENMRVHEYAKKVKISSKELLEKLSGKGFDFASHMSVLTSEAETFLDKQFKKSTKLIQKSSSKTPVKSSVKVVAKSSVKVSEKKKVKQVVAKKTIAHKFSPQRRFERTGRRATVTPRVVVTEIEVKDSMSLIKVAELMGKSAGDLIFVLLKKGFVCNINSVLAVDTIKMIAQEFNITAITDDAKKELSAVEQKFERVKAKGQVRWPIVVVMGHVDHGKTTLLDYLRKMNVAAKEKGGITQHIGAYEVDSAHGKMVFLDTPGHEAFSYMRKKGAKVTDIAILIVAADDGVKPQTVEAIKHAKDSGVPIIVAINKIDKPGVKAGAETIKRQLAQHDLVTEDWGGQTICVSISAKTGQGVEELLEMITLQSEIMELKADPNIPARAFVLESKMEKGYGPVATVIPIEGTLKQGDFFICGEGTGKVRLLIDSFGKKVTQAEPSIPVKIVGFDNFASIGEWLQVTQKNEYRKAKSAGVLTPRVKEQLAFDLTSAISDEQTQTTPEKYLNLIIKTDTNGSREAILGSLTKLTKQKKDLHYPIRIVSTGIGDISEGDIILAENTNAQIIGLHIKLERNAASLSKEKDIDVKLYDVIYHMVEDLEKFLLSKKVAESKWVKTGELEVLKVFNMKKLGIIAGCSVKDGIISKKNKVECIRGGKKIGEGKVVTLQRERKSVKDVHVGHECGFTTDNFSGWKIGDKVYAYSEMKEKESE